MKKITFKILMAVMLIGTTYSGIAQTLNQAANWPNANWTLTGTFTPAGLLSDPTVAGTTLTWDDDAAGNGSADDLQVTSPVIDLTAASGAGETFVTISGAFTYRALGGDILAIEIYDADSMTWSQIYQFAGNTTTTSDYQTCAISEAYTTPVIDISGYTATQLSGFQYRVTYDDLTGWQWGFCVESPTITSAVPPMCVPPSSLALDNVSDTDATVSWVNDATTVNIEFEFGLAGFTPGTGASVAAGSGPASAGPDAANAGGLLMPSTDYDFYVRSDCGPNGFSTWSGPVSFTTVSGPGAGCGAALAATVEMDCSTATPFTIDFTTAPNIGGTGTCDPSGDNRGLWYEFTAPASGTISISNSGANNEIVILDACGGTEIVCGGLPDMTDTTITGLIPGGLHKMAIWKDSFQTLTADDFCLEEITCTAPTFDTATIVDNCNPDGTGTFTVDIVVTDPGDGNSVLDDGTTTYPITAAGTITIGPYNSGDSVDVDLDNTVDDACDFFLATFTFTCPQPPPANDDCSGAVSLTPGGVYSDNPVDGTLIGATDSGFTNSCGGTATNDVWYTVVVPSGGDITIETGADIATGTTGNDTAIEVYTSDSDCTGTLTSIGCDDDGAATGAYSFLELTSLTPGQTLYIRLWGFGDDEFEPFSISAYSATLGLDDVENNTSFSYYPNPVKNTLTLNAQNNIENVTMYNMLGQEVLRAMPDALNSDLDMSELANGTYFVKVTIANTTETIRVIKQ